MNKHLQILTCAALVFVPLFAVKAESANETKLRETLRTTMLQLRDAQNQVANLQAEKVESDKLKASLKDDLDALTQKYKAEKELAENVIGKLKMQVAFMQRVITDRETKNLAMFKIAKEVLTRYEKFSLGEALSAKEPFTGLTRVKLENLVQDYQDKLSDQRVKMGDPITTEVKKEESSEAPKAEEAKKGDESNGAPQEEGSKTEEQIKKAEKPEAEPKTTQSKKNFKTKGNI